MSEVEKIRERYERRKQGAAASHEEPSYFVKAVLAEREARYEQVLRDTFGNMSDLRMLEIGAGHGKNLPFFHKLGLQWKNIYANELLDDRAEVLKENVPQANIYPGNAMELEFKAFFDVVFQSTVFTSILDMDFKRRLAGKIMDMVKPGGIVLWYDFRYDNPRNKDVKGIPLSEIKELFPGCRIDFHPVTLAPPIGRRIGSLYKLVNALFPFLRTHVIAVIHKDKK